MICTSCKQDLPVEKFHIRKNRSKGYESWCKACKNSRRRKKSSEEMFWANLKYSKGVSQKVYNDMHRAQGGKCLVCGVVGERMAVDHDHTTGLIRGLLCKRCNVGLGFFDDSVPKLKGAISYLTR